ncbi:MAG: SUMF1/EgtB/PvdO family nonheme iron enzyme [Acidobacteria bacterium]|nr:SUMF1/EgtB/PvdO family nonheme iron enzyme [Acidobacteriota bacterium]
MPRPNEQIGPYTLIRQLGRGGFGVVWLAERRGALATTKVALKLLLDDEPDLNAISQESQLWAQAGGHTNVLPIIEADIYDSQVVIASEYAPDGSLDSWMKEHGGSSPSLESAVSISIGILAGLEHLHSKKIIHRDLKPANILLQGEVPRLADFGLARVLKSSAHSGGIAGTPAYMSPEAFDGKRSERSDLWSVGVIFYQLLVGSLPFPSKDTVTLLRSIIMNEPAPLSNSIPEPLRQVVYYALRKDPDTRYQSATEMRIALRTAATLVPGMMALPSSGQLIALSPSNPLFTPSSSKEHSAIPRSSPFAKPFSEPTQTNTALGQFLPQAKAESPKVGLGLAEPKVGSFLESLPSLGASAIIPDPNVVGETVSDMELPSVQLTQALTFNLVTLLGNGKVKERKSSQVHYFTEDLSDSIKMDLVYIPPATFTMGSPFSEAKREMSEGPQHKATVAGFYMSKYLITQTIWFLVANWPPIYRLIPPQPSQFQGNVLPVEQVSWEDAIEFCARLSSYTGREYRLPSETEWEYAARAGQNSPFAFGDTITTDIVNYNGNFPYGSAPKGQFRNSTTPVGTMGVANAFGLYDMHGNVYEWCQDIWHDNYNGAPIDGSAWESGGDASRRVLRGGSWYHHAHNCRSAARLRSTPSVKSHFFGFRVVVSAAQS